MSIKFDNFHNRPTLIDMNVYETRQLMQMKKTLNDMIHNPELYQKAIAGGRFCAGFGGDLNGVKVPETFITVKLPAGMSPQEAFMQVVQFMAQTIKEAEMKNKA